MYVLENILPLSDEQIILLETNNVEYYLGMEDELEFDHKSDYEKAKKLLKIGE